MQLRTSVVYHFFRHVAIMRRRKRFCAYVIVKSEKFFAKIRRARQWCVVAVDLIQSNL